MAPVGNLRESILKDLTELVSGLFTTRLPVWILLIVNILYQFVCDEGY